MTGANDPVPGRGAVRLLLALACAVALACLLTRALPAHAQGTPDDDPHSIDMRDETGGAVSYELYRQNGDLDVILQRGILRVLVSYDDNNFYLENGESRGFEAELAKSFAKWLNARRGSAHPPLRLVFIPVPFESLITALEHGMGDIAAATLTVTPRRSVRAAFSRPYVESVSEVVVVRASDPNPPTSPEDLAGRTVHVLKNSSYAERLHDLNRRLHAKGKRLVVIEEAANDLQTEDLLDLLDAGVLETVVADSFQAAFWAGVLPGIRPLDVTLASGGSIAWAMEKKDKKLKRAVDEFFANEDGPQHRLSGPLLKRYYGPGRKLPDISHDLLAMRVKSLKPHFETYGDKYGLDWKFLLAQGVQESRLDQSAVSHYGAVGVMQVLPSTATSLGIGRVRESAEHNVQAGAAYMRQVMADYFADPAIPADERLLFALAAYNVGPNRVSKLRQVAASMNLDPNLWNGNVEWAAMRKVGAAPVLYVTNITKYHLLLTRLSHILPTRQEGLDKLRDAPAQ